MNSIPGATGGPKQFSAVEQSIAPERAGAIEISTAVVVEEHGIVDNSAVSNVNAFAVDALEIPGQTVTSETTGNGFVSFALDAELSVEATADVELGVVADSLDVMIDGMDAPPADVPVGKIFSTSVPELTMPVSTADIPAATLADVTSQLGADGAGAKVLGDALTNIDTSLTEGVLGQSELGKNQVLDQLLGKVREAMGPFVSIAAANITTKMGKELGKGSTKELFNEVRDRAEKKQPGGPRSLQDEARDTVRAQAKEPVPEVRRDEPSKPEIKEPLPKPEPSRTQPPPATAKATPKAPTPVELDPITVPSPELVRLEKTLTSSLSGLNLATGDIDALLQLVLMACARESAVDLREMIAEVQENNKKKKANREHVAALKEQQSAMKTALRKEYDTRCAIPGHELYIDSSRLSFDEFCKRQQLHIVEGDPSAVDADERPVGGVKLGVSPNTFYQPVEPPAHFDAHGNRIGADLVLRAERLGLSPRELQSIADVWSSDPALRAKFSDNFDALLVGPKAKGGLGLSVEPGVSQSSAVTEFINTHRAEIDAASARRSQEVRPPETPTETIVVGLAERLHLSDAQVSALQEFHAALFPSGEPAFESWLKQAAPAGAGVSESATSADNTRAINALFSGAKAPTSTQDPVSAAIAGIANLASTAGAIPNQTAEQARRYADIYANFINDLGTKLAAAIPGQAAKLGAIKNTTSQLAAMIIARAAFAKIGDQTKVAKCDEKIRELKSTLDGQIAGLPAPAQRIANNYAVGVVSAQVKMVTQMYWGSDLIVEQFRAKGSPRQSFGLAWGRGTIEVPIDGKTEWPYIDHLETNVLADAMNVAELEQQQPSAEETAAEERQRRAHQIAQRYVASPPPSRPAAAPPATGSGTIKPAPAPAPALTVVAVTPEMQRAISRLTAERPPPPVPPHDGSLRELTLDQLSTAIEEWQGKGDTLGDMSQEMSLRLQRYQERRAKFIETLSNVMKKLADVSSNISGNMK